MINLEALNPLRLVITSTLTLATYTLFKLFWEEFKPLKYIKKPLLNAVNKLGYKVYFEIEQIQDVVLKEKMRLDFDKLGNELDKAWDAGLNGKRKK